MPYGYKNTSVSLDAQLFTGTSVGIRIFFGNDLRTAVKNTFKKKTENLLSR